MLQRKSLRYGTGSDNKKRKKRTTDDGSSPTSSCAVGSSSIGGGVVRTNTSTLGGFLQKAQRTLLTSPWQIIQITSASSSRPDEYKLWALVQNELHQIKLIVPKVFYANLRVEKKSNEEGALFQKCNNKTLPRGAQIHNLYKYTVPNRLYDEFAESLSFEMNDPNVDGIYELNTPNLFRLHVSLGCVCRVTSKRNANRSNRTNDTNEFNLDDLESTTLFKQYYLPKDALKRLYLYQHRASNGQRQMYGLFLSPVKKALIIVYDTVRTNLMPNVTTLYQAELLAK